MQCNANSMPRGHLHLMGKLEMQKIGWTNLKLTIIWPSISMEQKQ